MGRVQYEAFGGFGFFLKASIIIKVSYVRNVIMLCNALENALSSIFAFLLCHLVSRSCTQVGFEAEAVAVTF